jgi:hypothetical protein
MNPREARLPEKLIRERSALLSFVNREDCAMSFRCTVSACCISLICTLQVEAAEIETLLLSEGPPVVITNMINAARMAINNNGDWVARIARSNGDVVCKNGIIIVDNNSPATTPDSIFDLSINNAGHAVSVAYNTAFNEYEVYFNDQLLVKCGQTSNIPELPAGTVYRTAESAVITDSNHVYVVGIVDEPGPQSYSLMARFEVDDTGAILDESLIYRNGHAITIPPEGGTLSNPPTDSWEWEVNNSGAILHHPTFFPEGGGSDQVLLLGEDALFQEDKVGQIGTRTNKYVRAAHLNDHGQWVAHVGFDDGNLWAQMMMRNGLKAIELGDALPNGGILKTLIEPVFISNDGDIYWLGSWTNLDTTSGTALFLNDSILVEDRVTEVDGEILIIDLGASGGTFGVSDDGRYVLFSAYWNGQAGLFRIAIPAELTTGIAASTLQLGAVEVSSVPRIDVTQVRLLHSTDLRHWVVPPGPVGDWVLRPPTGWSSAPPSWQLTPGAGGNFYRVSGTNGF